VVARECARTGELNLFQIRRRRPSLSRASRILKQFGRVEKGKGANCRYHPLIHTFGSRKDTTTCGGGSERAIVWIKVCNLHFREKSRRIYTLSI
jgi:hypothetical protein